MNQSGENKTWEDQRLVLDAADVSRLLGLSRGATYNAIATGQIPSVRVGRRILVPRIGLQDFLNGAVNRTSEWQPEKIKSRPGESGIFCRRTDYD